MIGHLEDATITLIFKFVKDWATFSLPLFFFSMLLLRWFWSMRPSSTGLKITLSPIVLCSRQAHSYLFLALWLGFCSSTINISVCAFKWRAFSVCPEQPGQLRHKAHACSPNWDGEGVFFFQCILLRRLGSRHWWPLLNQHHPIWRWSLGVVRKEAGEYGSHCLL